MGLDFNILGLPYQNVAFEVEVVNTDPVTEIVVTISPDLYVSSSRDALLIAGGASATFFVTLGESSGGLELESEYDTLQVEIEVAPYDEILYGDYSEISVLSLKEVFNPPDYTMADLMRYRKYFKSPGILRFLIAQ